ncbi:MAG: DUF4388 domain-containing protein [Nitrospinota bacterium]
MALQGNLKDFAITNILPMIKMESKTGSLEVKFKNDYVRIVFLEGQIVYGETVAERDAKRVRDTLLANRLMSQEGWGQLQKQHSDTLDSMWNVLVTMVSPDTTKRLLRRQVTDAVFELMRFQKGVYKFAAAKQVEYPEKLITPMDVDFLLMEGARITDELSMVEKRLPPKTTFLRKAILSEESPDESVQMDASQREFAESLELEILKERGVSVSEAERSVLSIIHEYRRVGELLDMADLSYFDACAAIVSLLKKQVLTPVSRKKVVAAKSATAKSGAVFGYVLILAAVALVALAGQYRFNNFPGQIADAEKAVESLLAQGVKAELKNIFYGLKVYSYQAGKQADTLRDLVSAGIIEQKNLTDPWGRPYEYATNENGFALFSLGPDGRNKGGEIFFEVD